MRTSEQINEIAAALAKAQQSVFAEYREEMKRLKALNADLLEALKKLRAAAALLLQNAEGCAVNHYGDDFATHGMPGWLADCAADIEAARAAIAKAMAPTAALRARSRRIQESR